MVQNRKKILILITQSVSGGAQKYVFDLATNLDKEKCEVAVAAGGHAERGSSPAQLGGNGELFRQLGIAGVKIFRLKWLRRMICPICDIAAYFEIKRLLGAWQPDVLHLNSSKAAVLGSLAASRLIKSGNRSSDPLKVVYTVHGAVFEASFPWLARRFFLWLEKWTAKYKDKIICVSEHDRHSWLKYNVAPPEKLVTIHNGIDLGINFLPKEEARQKLLNTTLCHPEFISGSNKIIKQIQHDTFSNYQIIGWLGYFYPEKNLETLINAANLILKLPSAKQKNIIFVIVGSGPQKKSLELQVTSLSRRSEATLRDYKLQDKILFLGHIPQAQKYLKAFDVFTLPSTKEGLPYTILEAMAAGIPIVASEIGGIPEMVQDGINGFLIRPRDAEALAEKILQILENSDLAQKFSQNSLERIKEFSLEKMVEQTQKQY